MVGDTFWKASFFAFSSLGASVQRAVRRWRLRRRALSGGGRWGVFFFFCFVFFVCFFFLGSLLRGEFQFAPAWARPGLVLAE